MEGVDITELAHELILAMRDTDVEHWDTLEGAAAELRRLHALNAELVEALRRAVNAWFRPHGINYVDFKPYMEAARAALAKVEASK